ncbi:hypothetical protein Tcan_01007, partial [Toxocara canis]
MNTRSKKAMKHAVSRQCDQQPNWTNTDHSVKNNAIHTSNIEVAKQLQQLGHVVDLVKARYSNTILTYAPLFILVYQDILHVNNTAFSETVLLEAGHKNCIEGAHKDFTEPVRSIPQNLYANSSISVMRPKQHPRTGCLHAETFNTVVLKLSKSTALSISSAESRAR